MVKVSPLRTGGHCHFVNGPVLLAGCGAAGAVAKKLLKQRFGVEVLAYVKQVKKIVAYVNPDKVKLRDVEANIVRCPDSAVADKMIRLIERTRKAGDPVNLETDLLGKYAQRQFRR